MIFLVIFLKVYPVLEPIISKFSIALQIGNLEKNVQNLKVQLAGAHGNHKEAMDQVNCLHCCPLLLHLMKMLLLIAKPSRERSPIP